MFLLLALKLSDREKQHMAQRSLSSAEADRRCGNSVEYFSGINLFTLEYMITSFREIVLFTPLSSNVIPCRNFQLQGSGL